MVGQMKLSSFSEKTIDMDESTKGFRPWNNKVVGWEIEYQGYANDEEKEGYLDFIVEIEIVEALVKIKVPEKSKKVERPGYRLLVTQSVRFENEFWTGISIMRRALKRTILERQ